MARRSWLWFMVVALVAAVLLPNSADAKRFKRYPDDLEEAEKVTNDRPPDNSSRPTSDGVADTSTPPESERDGAEDVRDEEDKDDEDQPPGLFGYALHGNDGLKAEYIYTGEVFTNMRGGMSTRDATRYLGLIDIAITGDLDKLGFRPGGTVFLLAEDSHGMGLTTDFVGDRQWLSNIDPGAPFTQVTEYWWQRGFFDDALTLRMGKQDANAEFAVVDLGGDFINSSFGTHHSVPMPTWPNTSMGIMAIWKVAEPLALKYGFYDGAAAVGSWGFSGTGISFSLAECETQWTLDDGRLPGDFHVGMWYHNGPWVAVNNEDFVHTGNHGLYFGLDQLLWKESDDKEDEQGLGFFLQYAWCPESVNEVSHYYGSGLVYRGLIPCRDKDITGLGVAQVVFGDPLEHREPETAVELFHKVPVSPYITIQPDLQYIAHPDGQYRDAFVFGLRFEAVL